MLLREPLEQAYAREQEGRERLDDDRQYWLDNFRCDLQDALQYLGPDALRQLVEDAIHNKPEMAQFAYGWADSPNPEYYDASNEF